MKDTLQHVKKQIVLVVLIMTAWMSFGIPMTHATKGSDSQTVNENIPEHLTQQLSEHDNETLFGELLLRERSSGTETETFEQQSNADTTNDSSIEGKMIEFSERCSNEMLTGEWKSFTFGSSLIELLNILIPILKEHDFEASRFRHEMVSKAVEIFIHVYVPFRLDGLSSTVKYSFECVAWYIAATDVLKALQITESKWADQCPPPVSPPGSLKDFSAFLEKGYQKCSPYIDSMELLVESGVDEGEIRKRFKELLPIATKEISSAMTRVNHMDPSRMALDLHLLETSLSAFDLSAKSKLEAPKKYFEKRFCALFFHSAMTQVEIVRGLLKKGYGEGGLVDFHQKKILFVRIGLAIGIPCAVICFLLIMRFYLRAKVQKKRNHLVRRNLKSEAFEMNEFDADFKEPHFFPL